MRTREKQHLQGERARCCLSATVASTTTTTTIGGNIAGMSACGSSSGCGRRRRSLRPSGGGPSGVVALAMSLALASAVARLLPAADGGKVLVYHGGACYSSHSMVMEHMAALLASPRGGHRVTMLVRSGYSGPLGEHVDLSGVELLRYAGGAGGSRASAYCGIDVAARRPSMLELIMAWQSDVQASCEALLSHGALLAALKASAYDLLVVDNVDACARALVDYVDVPFVVLATARQPLAAAELVDFVQVPHMMLPFTGDMSLAQRVVNALTYAAVELLASAVFLPAVQSIKARHGVNASLPLGDTLARSAVNFVYYADAALDYPQASLPKNVAVGAFLAESRTADRLRGAARDFMDECARDGTAVAIVSFGSHVARLPPAVRDALIGALRRLPLAIVWRDDTAATDETATTALGNVTFSPAVASAAAGVAFGSGGGGSNHRRVLSLPWLPQAELLAHPAARVFISHGGLSGALEAAYNGVPVVVLPLHGEQRYQSLKLTQHARMGVSVDASDLTAERLGGAIAEVLDNPAYRRNAAAVSRRMRDKPMTARDQILFWVDYVVRNGGGVQAPPPRARAWYETFLLDVLAVLAIGAAVVIALLIAAFRCAIALAARAPIAAAAALAYLRAATVEAAAVAAATAAAASHRQPMAAKED